MNDQITREDWLAHYGVKGMKWGVRRNPSKAYNKAVKKAKKIENKATKLEVKGDKKLYKSSKKMARATDMNDYKKAVKLQLKGNKYNLKSAKLKKKGLKWKREMDKVFKDYDIKKVKKETTFRGQQFVYELTKKS